MVKFLTELGAASVLMHLAFLLEEFQFGSLHQAALN
jgi:hypothetical protein